MVEVGNVEKSMYPASGISEFETEYVIQTRKEIDTEKQERNKILNYGVLAVGAISVGLLQFESKGGNPNSPWLLLMGIPLLTLITGLVAARRMKLHQIADRWITLYRMLRKRNLEKEWLPLERIVVDGLISNRYLGEDIWVHTALSFVGYGLICYVGKELLYPPNHWSALIAVILLAHFFFSTFCWLRRPFLDIDELKKEFG